VSRGGRNNRALLKILEPYDLKAMGHNSAPYLHHLIEAKKLAYADLARYVGDADHLDIPPEQMLSDAFSKERRSHLDESHATAHVDPGPAQTASETIYLTTADSAGDSLIIEFVASDSTAARQIPLASTFVGVNGAMTYEDSVDAHGAFVVHRTVRLRIPDGPLVSNLMRISIGAVPTEVATIEANSFIITVLDTVTSRRVGAKMPTVAY
jgi:hypothetical protein